MSERSCQGNACECLHKLLRKKLFKTKSVELYSDSCISIEQVGSHTRRVDGFLGKDGIRGKTVTNGRPSSCFGTVQVLQAFLVTAVLKSFRIFSDGGLHWFFKQKSWHKMVLVMRRWRAGGYLLTTFQNFEVWVSCRASEFCSALVLIRTWSFVLAFTKK